MNVDKDIIDKDLEDVNNKGKPGFANGNKSGLGGDEEPGRLKRLFDGRYSFIIVVAVFVLVNTLAVCMFVFDVGNLRTKLITYQSTATDNRIMQERLDRTRAELDDVRNDIEEEKGRLAEKEEAITEKETELAEKETELAEKEESLADARTELENRENSLAELEARLHSDEADPQANGFEFKDIVKIYENMDAKNAARIISALDMADRVRIIKSMKNSKASEILSEMEPSQSASIMKEIMK